MKAEKRKQLILDCAKRLFSHYGYYRTQISDITKEAKIARGTIYQYFENKQDIFITLLESAYQRWEVRIKTTFEFLVADPDICNIAMTMGFGLPPDLEEATRRIEEKIIVIAINDFKLGLHNDHVRENLNIRLVGEMLTGAIFSCVYFALLRADKQPHKVDVVSLTDEIVALFAPGIFKQPTLLM